MQNWHKTAHGNGVPQHRLNELFAVKSQTVNSHGNNNRGKSRGRSRNRRGRTQQSDDKDESDASGDDNIPPKKQIRITLNSPRLDRRGRVIPGSQNKTITTLNAGS